MTPHVQAQKRVQNKLIVSKLVMERVAMIVMKTVIVRKTLQIENGEKDGEI